MNTEIVKIIEAGLSNDRSMVIKFSKQLIKNLDSTGDSTLAKRIINLLNNKARDFVSLDEISSIPVDAESRFGIADIEFLTEKPASLILNSSISKQLQHFLAGIKNKDQLQKAGVEVINSLLLYGPPGCGKSSIARFIAHELSLPLVIGRLDTLVSSLLGSTSKNIKRLFDYAASKPCILFLDEFDAVAKARDDQNELGELKRVVNSLLQNIDAFTKDSILITATNHHEILDRAVWRRFESVIHVPKPGKYERVQLINIFLNSYTIEKCLDDKKVEHIATLLEDLSPSEIKNILSNAIRNSVVSNKNKIEFTDILLELFVFKKRADFSEDEIAKFLITNGVTQEATMNALNITYRQIKKINANISLAEVDS